MMLHSFLVFFFKFVVHNGDDEDADVDALDERCFWIFDDDHFTLDLVLFKFCSLCFVGHRTDL